MDEAKREYAEHQSYARGASDEKLDKMIERFQRQVNRASPLSRNERLAYRAARVERQIRRSDQSIRKLWA